ncbi:MAG TPA: hypothetical protein VFX96_11280, partial [Pyrinomonadaceae bacterium]|nr:hypothetical protein [Pyrinomonadaceae bacterium]
MKRLITFFATAALVFTTAAPLALAQGGGHGAHAPAPKAASASVAERVKQLNELLKEQWEYVLETNPEFASILGDKRYNDKIGDFSQAAIDRDIERQRVFLKKFEAIDATGFPEQDRLNRDLMVRDLRQ